MGDRRGHGGAGRALLLGLSSPCGAGGFCVQEGKERAGARGEVPWLGFLTKMK